jgi:hypothetical protein
VTGTRPCNWEVVVLISVFCLTIQRHYDCVILSSMDVESKPVLNAVKYGFIGKVDPLFDPRKEVARQSISLHVTHIRLEKIVQQKMLGD